LSSQNLFSHGLRARGRSTAPYIQQGVLWFKFFVPQWELVAWVEVPGHSLGVDLKSTVRGKLSGYDDVNRENSRWKVQGWM